MLTHEKLDELQAEIYEAVLQALLSVGEDCIKAGPFFGSGEYREIQAAEAA